MLLVRFAQWVLFVRQAVGKDQHPDLDWRGDVPIARRFDDPYFSLEDGWAETRHVFLDGNGLPGRFADGFQIAELGFGTGLNAFAALAAWRAAEVKGTLNFTSFERYPMGADQMARALSVYPDLAALAEPFLACADDWRDPVALDGFRLEVIVGDARTTLADWRGQADAWFLDGFAPSRNPEMWQDDLLRDIARHTPAGGTLATYTAAGAVRRGLEAAGFVIERRPGFGRKRHMTAGWLPRGD
ncbi:MAG: tRNA (5-methylaminomethyl-2-thiouridine)(34)-methyltransferase MnmD [Silicimonas sp.]|nr:tRNA (5-methylaminomethyl-2-thiouridine)(34)-methyltransferase MnmD [Silicimonas sp.]